MSPRPLLRPGDPLLGLFDRFILPLECTVEGAAASRNAWVIYETLREREMREFYARLLIF